MGKSELRKVIAGRETEPGRVWTEPMHRYGAKPAIKVSRRRKQMKLSEGLGPSLPSDWKPVLVMWYLFSAINGYYHKIISLNKGDEHFWAIYLKLVHLHFIHTLSYEEKVAPNCPREPSLLFVSCLVFF